MNKSILFSSLIICAVVGLSRNVDAQESSDGSNRDIVEFDNKQQEQLYRDLVLELRCPKCQNQNIADSNAVVAKDMRNKTIELVKQGQDRQQVIDYMVTRYGQFAHYQPPLNVATSMLWIVPIGFVFIAVLLLYRRSKSKAEVSDVLTSDTDLDENLSKLIDQTKSHNNPSDISPVSPSKKND